MGGGGGFGGIGRIALGVATGGLSEVAMTAAGKLSGGGGSSGNGERAPTAASVDATEADVDKLRRQRLAALMAGGRAGVTQAGGTAAGTALGAAGGKSVIGG